MTDTTLERCARAAQEADDQPTVVFDARYERIARAVINELMGPTQEMLRVGEAAFDDAFWHKGENTDMYSADRAAWQAMLQAVLDGK